MSIEAAVTGIIDEYEITPDFYHGDLDEKKIKFKKALET
jgi:hypothetical protein